MKQTSLQKLVLLIGSMVFLWEGSRLEAKPLKVFILAGQSNMEGHAKISTFPFIAKDPKTADLYKEMVDGDGNPKECENVWIAYSYGGAGGTPGGTKTGKLSAGWGSQNNPGPGKIGPEFTFGIYMNKMLQEPILLIKTAWGGKSLHTDYRPPSAGESTLVAPEKASSEDKKKKKTQDRESGEFYNLMMDYVKEVLADPKAACPVYDPKEGYELAGFVWFQGFNDMVGPYPEKETEGQEAGKGKKEPKPIKDFSEYSRLLSCFIRDVRKDLSAPQLPFVIGVLGVGGKDADGNNLAFRKSQAATAETEEFKGSVVNVLTENFWPVEIDVVEEKVSEVKSVAIKKEKKQLKDIEDKSEAKAIKEKSDEELDRKIRETLTEDEYDLLTNGTSNAPFHYYGSAKFFAQAGKAFAEALMGISSGKK